MINTHTEGELKATVLSPASSRLDARILDKEWRMENLYYVTNKQGQVVRFKMNHAQRFFFRNRGKRNIILKSRQLGFTTYEAIDMLDDILFTRSSLNALMFSFDEASQLDIFDNKIMLAWELFPLKQYYKVDTKRANKLEVKLKEGVYSAITVRSSGRSGTFQRIHVSEYAKICKKYPDKAFEIKSGTFQAVPTTGRIDIESTAEGEFGDFHDMFWDAWNRVKTGKLPSPVDFKAFFFNWRWDIDEIKAIIPIPVEQMEESDKFAEIKKRHKLSDKEITYYYLKWIVSGKDWKTLRQEYPITPEEAFVASGNKLFDADIIATYKRENPIRKTGDWVIFEEPKRGHVYGIGADISEGIGKDSSTVVVWDFTLALPRMVARFKSDKIEPDLFAYELKWAGESYNNALVAPERNNMGRATIVKLREIYDNIYKYTRMDEETNIETEKLGWETNLSTKPKMMYDFKTAVNNKLVHIPDGELLTECRTYDKENLREAHTTEKTTRHWDILIAAAIGYQMRLEVSESSGNTKTITTSSQNDIHSGV